MKEMKIMWTQEQKIKVYNMIMYYRSELVKRGFDVYSIVNVKYGRSINTWGTCTRYTNEKIAIIKISEICLHSTEEALKTIILHELCHAMPNTSGHDTQFFRYARMINKEFHVNIEKYVNKEFKTNDTKYYKETKYKYYVNCEKCGKQYKFMRKTKFIKSVLDGTNTQYVCGCGCHKFTIKIY